MSKVAPCLWFERDAEPAAAFYCSLIPGSRVERVQRSPTDTPSGREGDVLMVEFTLDGRRFQALNGGRPVEPNWAVSLSVSCEEQAEVDRIWAAILETGGTAQRCGWITDRWGFSWQIVPRAMAELLGDPDPARAKRAMQAMLTMVKLDVAALRAAADAG